MGIPSLSIVFHEILKMLHHAGATDVKFFRLGTSGGLGLEPGSVVISETAKDGLLRPYMEIVSLFILLTHISLASFLWDIGKRCKIRSDAVKCGV